MLVPDGVRVNFLALDGTEADYVRSGTLVHHCVNPGAVPVRVIWVITPPHY